MSIATTSLVAGLSAAGACALVAAATFGHPERSGRRPLRGMPQDRVRRRPSFPTVVGSVLRRSVGAPAEPAAAQLLGTMVLAGGAVALLDPRLGVVIAVVLRLRPILRTRRDRLTLERAVVRELPEVIDLVRLGLASGGSVLIALRAVAVRPIGPVSRALAQVVAEVGAGHRMADALDDLPGRLGQPARPLVRALVASERYGVELGPTLERLAHDAREDRRRRAQTQARRVPVQMLVPLVLCVLPAFVLLTLVPTLVSTLETLDL